MYTKFGKQIFDFLLASMLSVFFLPIIAILYIILKFKFKNPIFTQTRPGKDGKLFKIYKFKSMNDDRDSQGNLLPDEQRITPLGNILRKLSLDELPQIINVLKGELSFVGPRPLLVEYLDLYSTEQIKRHDVKPGITGWAQINGRNALSWDEKFKLDLYYVKNISFLFDLKILIMTALKVLKRSDIYTVAGTPMSKFNGKN